MLFDMGICDSCDQYKEDCECFSCMSDECPDTEITPCRFFIHKDCNPLEETMVYPVEVTKVSIYNFSASV